MQNQNVTNDSERKIRRRDLDDSDKKNAQRTSEERKNKNFTQVYPLGWKRLLKLAKNTGAFALYSFLAEHIDEACGAVVCDQSFLAKQMSVSVRTIQRRLDFLEEERCLVRIPVSGKVCAYALNPHEVWKGYDTQKEYSAFLTKTIVNKDGDINRKIRAMFSGTEIGQEQ